MDIKIDVHACAAFPNLHMLSHTIKYNNLMCENMVRADKSVRSLKSLTGNETVSLGESGFFGGAHRKQINVSTVCYCECVCVSDSKT